MRKKEQKQKEPLGGIAAPPFFLHKASMKQTQKT